MSKTIFGDNWEIDKLEREEEAAFLSEYLIGKSKLGHSELNDGSFVLNVNAEWGFGKTYFLTNWADELSAKGHPVVYFDAWQNDFSKEPLIAFISTINAQLDPYFNKKIGKKRATKVKHLLSEWYNKGKKLASPSSPFLWSIAAKKLAGMSIEQIGELFDEEIDEETSTELDKENKELKKEVENTVSTVVSKAAASLLASHNSTKKTIADFKVSLENLTHHLNTLKSINIPIFIFVDELDRCRPNYAIELLENIKHLFGVPGVYFIVATASEQLCHSIKKIYGQDFDSSRYIKRFFDQTYSLKEPDRKKFAEYLFYQYKLDTRQNLFSPLDQKLFEGKNIKVEAFAIMSDALNIGLRDMIQYCVIIDSVCLTFTEAPVHLVYLIFLTWLKDTRKDLYDLIAGGVGISKDEIPKLNPSLSKTIATYAPKDRHGSTLSTIRVSEVINEYIRLSGTSLNAIFESWNRGDLKRDIIRSIESSLRGEMPNSYPSDTTLNHHLSHYPKLIEQAGRIT
ncbi:KAP family P-loop NTPase fold protein [Desulfogranum japonicum]|uniref:KAP family P-loop NTPase fold protein n=1 Tax=Desulfogranum japonicum TaxID=231447 RepID=UPI0003FFB607|nr:P-loop NTPase fold protein [Desulfogranum japonicum]